ncbi:RNA polymerase factor sigma-54 [Pontibacter sp. BT310]|uniref:RNA polymerase factor sigma-54 n=1 Tax=Pontibacter populi TaxID=890055 RepID=A0ABS6X8M4_9BACT|nr:MULTISPECIES: RNA polymerase factor sigma-54 [Pontibacter]MBJ6117475.1 RNA polymerase factor sigma-54 [Pontibacter sp. BT310]MBR0569900.1 RNA polymerase factor sigma-54 [Microvirga sp. STS03]MBW3364328.1 RNA polymerase factor sigma-54 [Pontibacter populi]
MQRLDLRQLLQQKLSPQQIQFIKLLQIPTAELEMRIKEELEINPALEEGADQPEDQYNDSDSEEYGDNDDDYGKDDVDINDYLNDDEISGYKMQGDRGGEDEDDREMPIAVASSLTDQLMDQLGFLDLDDKQHIIGMQLIGSIDNDGYIRRDLSAIANDLAFSQNIETSEEEIEEVLHMIQTFDPAGIAARDLPECLLLQLHRRDQDETIILAERILEDAFDEFTKKHYQKIQSKFGVSEDELKKAIDIITKLNPKPGGAGAGMTRIQYIIPDFILTNNNGQLELSLNSRNAPDLRISRSYADMFDAYDKSDKKDKKLKETVTFVKQKLDAAKWFIDAIRQRQNTLLRTMESIIKYQHNFFLEGDESELRPMILKDIAEDIGMDISTVSRVANSKAVQTEFGIYPLKYFFSEGIATDSGEDASSREVKHILKEIIDGESKRKPLSDEKIEQILNEKGYNIARRTVAKYREQLNIPVARLRKEL